MASPPRWSTRGIIWHEGRVPVPGTRALKETTHFQLALPPVSNRPDAFSSWDQV